MQDGLTPMQYANEGGHEEIARLFQVVKENKSYIDFFEKKT